MEILRGTADSQRGSGAARRAAARVLGALALAAFFLAAVRGQMDEYRVKAAFLYNFAKFVDWPAQAFQGPDSPIVICVLGQNPFGATLEETVSGKAAGGRNFVVKQVPALQTPGNCQILFVASSERKRFRAIRANLKGAGVLTVGEAEGFTADGGVINFKLEGGSIRLEINIAAAEYEDLRISSKLLSMAEVVRKAP